MASVKIFVVLALLAAVSAESQTRIVGGTPTSIEEFPYIVSMVYYYPGIGITVQRCVGCLLSSWHVLTSGFCFTGAVFDNMQVRAGSTNSLSGGILINLNEVIKHPEYAEKPRVNDIALVTLLTPLGISNTVNIMYLPGPGTYIPDGAVGKVVSWGFETEGGPQLQTLKTVELYKLNLDECTARYSGSDAVEISENVICATAQGRGMCDGDSGAPMAVGQVAIGLFSHHQGCEPNEYPDVFTRIDKYTNWIIDVSTNSGQRSVNLKTASLVL